MKLFSKNDNSFICENCNKLVSTLKYTSRDHCPKCLCSLHVDVNPGDRQNSCKGLLVPYCCKPSSKKGYVITYKCQKCGKFHNNKTADDDDLNVVFSVMNGTYKLINIHH